MRKLLLLLTVIAVGASAPGAIVQHAVAAPKPDIKCTYSSEQAVKDMYEECKPSCNAEKNKTGCLAACVRIRDTCLRKMEQDKAADRARKAAAQQAKDDEAAKQKARADEKKDVTVHPSLVCQETPVECMVKCHNRTHDDNQCAKSCGGETALQKFKKCVVH